MDLREEIIIELERSGFQGDVEAEVLRQKALFPQAIQKLKEETKSSEPITCSSEEYLKTL